jgi:hypothetical protein
MLSAIIPRLQKEALLESHIQYTGLIATHFYTFEHNSSLPGRAQKMGKGAIYASLPQKSHRLNQGLMEAVDAKTLSI